MKLCRGDLQWPNHKNRKQEVSYCTRVHAALLFCTQHAGPSVLHAFIIHQHFQKEFVSVYIVYALKLHSGTTQDSESSLLFWHMRRSCAFCCIPSRKAFLFIYIWAQKWSAREQRKQTKTTPSSESEHTRGMNKWFTELRPKWKYYSLTRHMRVCLY